MTAQLKIVVAVIWLLNEGLCANILYIAPLPSPSHYLWNKALSMGLVERGHNITMLTHESEKVSAPRNFTVITMEGFYEDVRKGFDIEGRHRQTNTFLAIKSVYDFVEYTCTYDMKTKGLDQLLSYPEDYKFDLVIFDVTTGQCFYPIIDRFRNPPVVAVTPFSLPPVLSSSLGNNLYSSYLPYYNTKFTSTMSFAERILNLIYINTELLIRNYISVPKQFELAKKRFGENIRTIEETERSISLLLSNVDPVLDYPMPLPPNIIPVGGLHIKPARELPEDLQQILSRARHGVILFSLGTNVRSDKLRPQQQRALLKAFTKLPQIVLWKFEADTLVGCPENVIIRKWLPQNDILGHPNTRLFISHGGALSTQEAMYHGVPLVGIPFYVDQHGNIGKMVQRQLARYLDHNNLTANNVYEAVNDVLQNPAYAENMKIISTRYRDQLQSPLERGIFWVEYMLRHGSAEHLTLAARDMPGYQTANLDVLAVLVCNLILALVLFPIAGYGLIGAYSGYVKRCILLIN